LSRNKSKSDIEEEQKQYQGGARRAVERSKKVSKNRNKNGVKEEHEPMLKRSRRRNGVEN
jgi:hypothetical protein